MEIERVSDGSPDLRAELVARLREAAPEAFAEGKLDVEKLKALVGDAVEARPERYEFSWAGKRDAIAMLQAPTRATLVPDQGASVDFDSAQHVFIEGENLEVLKVLYRSYFGRVKLIYIDPPYNTGNDFIYSDDFSDPLEHYLHITGQKNGNGDQLTSQPERTGRYHSGWVSMMYPRLSLARQFLREDGFMFVSIDDHEAHNLRRLMDLIFGEENFIGQVCVASNPRVRQSEIIATSHEYVIAYARDVNRCAMPGQALNESQVADYKYKDEKGHKYRLRGLRHRGNASRRIDRPNMYFPIYVNPETKAVALEETSEFSVPVVPRKSTGEDGRWEWGTKTVRDRLERLEGVYISGRGEWDIYQREFLQNGNGEERKIKWKSLWDEKEINYQNGKKELEQALGSAPFEYPKPQYLLRKIVEGTTSGTDVVLDFFAGSGGSGQAVVAANKADGGSRQVVLIQIPEKTSEEEFPTIAEIARERLRRVIRHTREASAEELPLGGDGSEYLGLRCFKLDSSNIRRWSGVDERTVDAYGKQLEAFADTLVSGWKIENVIWEVALREGFSLTAAVAKVDAPKGGAFWRVVDAEKDQSFTITLDDTLTLEAVHALGLGKDDLFICRDTALDDTLAANLALQCHLKVI